MIKHINKNIELMNHTDDLVNKVMYMDSVAYERMDGESGYTPTPPSPIGEYFTIVFLEDGELTYQKDHNRGELYYSMDEGTTWSIWEDSATHSFRLGDRVTLKGNLVSTVSHHCGDFYTSAPPKVNLEGNYMSIKYLDDFEDKTEFPASEYNNNGLCWLLLVNLKIVDASKMIIPLQRIPDFGKVFRNLLGEQPELIASPILATETLTAHSLGGCYKELFKDDSKLNKVICLAKNNLNNDTMRGWLTNTAATGVIYKDPQADWSEAPIPSGWTLEDYQG